MGVVNVTPDSFYSGSRKTDHDNILDTVQKMIENGAAMIDIGGHSTRPGAEPLSTTEELQRVIPVITLLRQELPDCILSIDTYRAEVARASIEAGASIVNDISGGQLDQHMLSTLGELRVPFVAGHLQGDFSSMMSQTNYDDLLTDITDFFAKKINQLHDLGVNDIVIDPGFGFSKTLDQNYELLKYLPYFSNLGMPVMIGVSRKSMIWKFLETSPEEALNGTTVLNTIALIQGASILRVHDVKEAFEAVCLYKKTFA